jgi:hypothetical protein
MKKIILTALCGLFALFVAQHSHAQGFGIKGGLNFATISGETNGFSKENFTGYHLGAYGYLKFNPLLGLQAELNYTQVGSKSTFNIGSISTVASSSFNYFQIPVLLRVQAGASDFKIWGNAGPYAGFFIGGTTVSELSGGITGIVTKTTDDLKSGDDIASLDWGVMAGVGAGYKVGPGYITLDARYALGLARVPGTTATTVGTLSPDDVKNRTIMLSLGYLFVF